VGVFRVTTARATFPDPTVAGGAAPVNATCAPASGSEFPLGSTATTCTATDSAGTTATCTFQVRVRQVAGLRMTNYLAFGDSITEGFLREPPGASYQPPFELIVPELTYPAQLLSELQTNFPLQTFTVTNEGRGGEFTQGGRARIEGVITRHRPEVLLLLEGYNGLLVVQPDDTEADLRYMVRAAQVRGVMVLLATLTPVSRFRERDAPGSTNAINALNTRIRRLASTLGIAPAVDLHAAFGTDESLLGSDGLHPNAAGYRRMAETFYAAIASRFREEPTQTLSGARVVPF
jgi:lysophospholipase L1-like esterase